MNAVLLLNAMLKLEATSVSNWEFNWSNNCLL